MSDMPYHKRYHSDALAGFMSLTLEQRGAYQTLLDMIYDRGGSIHDNERLLAGYMQCSVRLWRKLRSDLLEKGKIYITADGHISNDRAEKEIENAAKTSRERAENGSKGARVKRDKQEKSKENNVGTQATLERSSSYIRSQILESSVTNVTGDEPPDPAKMMFDQGVALLTSAGTKQAQARTLIGKWRKAKGDGWVMETIAAARGRSVTNPVEWIEGRIRFDARGPPVTARSSAEKAARRYALLDAQRETGAQADFLGGISSTEGIDGNV